MRIFNIQIIKNSTFKKLKQDYQEYYTKYVNEELTNRRLRRELVKAQNEISLLYDTVESLSVEKSQ